MTLAGTLSLAVPPTATDGQVIPVVTIVGAGKVDGTFSNVNVTTPNHSCSNVQANFDTPSLSVLLRTDGCAKALSTGAIAGIAVGGAVAVAVVVGTLGWLYWRKRKRTLRGAVHDRN